MYAYELFPLLEQLKDILALTGNFLFDEDSEIEQIDHISSEISIIIDRLNNNDTDALLDLVNLFSPTGYLYTSALNNGWSEIYHELSSMINHAIID